MPTPTAGHTADPAPCRSESPAVANDAVQSGRLCRAITSDADGNETFRIVAIEDATAAPRLSPSASGAVRPTSSSKAPASPALSPTASEVKEAYFLSEIESITASPSPSCSSVAAGAAADSLAPSASEAAAASFLRSLDDIVGAPSTGNQPQQPH